MLKVNTAHNLECIAKRAFTFILKIIEAVCSSLVKMNLSVEHPLEQLVQGGFTITVFSVYNSYLAISRTLDFTMVSKVAEIFKFNISYVCI